MTKQIAGTVMGIVLASAGLAMPPLPLLAQDTGDDDAADQNIIVTATRIRQGGAQDIKHFRSVAFDGSFLPHTNSLSLEGLLGEHDLTLPAKAACAQMFCVNGYAMQASLPSRPQDEFFIGLGFESNIDAEAWKGEPLSLIAVVDRSGSMSGQPIARVKEGLLAALQQLRPGDRMGIVIYGSSTVVHLPVTDVEGNRDAIASAIRNIEIDGSTYMEAGLRLGYATAREELARSKGKTRLMLFTDENPNVGNVSPEGFMALAKAGSEQGIGLTTIGVGVHFDGALANRVSSVRGGNLFFLDRSGDAGDLFEEDFFNMVSEVAHDVTITMTPSKGYKITGVFGVPDGMMTEAPDGAVSVTVGSAFLSSNGGGIYASLGREGDREYLPLRQLDQGEPLLTAAISYTDATNGEKGRNAEGIMLGNGAPPERLRAAHMLVDEYFGLTEALALYHQQNDRKGAFAKLDSLTKRMEGAGLEGFDKEVELVSGLRGRAAYLAGYGGELPKELRHLSLVGEWEVVSLAGVNDLSRGDTVQITERGEFITQRTAGRDKGDEIRQSYQVNEQQLYIEYTDLVLNYRVTGDRLVLSMPLYDVRITLRRKEG
ncbi:MAG: VWA domain-containing protein [Sphingomonadaceae bacterium]|nr:VWA domain-containing protein [Sphingomonadaceae bacterium]